MSRKSPDLCIEEIPGDTYQSLVELQHTAKGALASDLAITLRSLLARGVLIVQDGKIQPNPQR